MQTSVAAEQERRRRLFHDEQYAPWVRAPHLEDCFLFYVPVTGYPCREQEKLWFHEFYQRLSQGLEQRLLRGELFLRYKGVEQFGDSFLRYAQKCQMRIGMARATGQELPQMPTQEQIDAYVKNPERYNYKDWIAEYLYWFVTKQPQVQRQLFMGHGQLLTLFLPPDPSAPPSPPKLTPALRDAFPVFKTMDVDALIKGTLSSGDMFQAKSKKMFGVGMEERPDYPALRFVLPLLESGDFFTATPEVRTEWFSLFDVYVRESVQDRGVLLAFEKEEYATLLMEVTEAMRMGGWILRSDRR